MADKLGVAEYELQVEFRDYLRDMQRAESETTKRTSSMTKAFGKIADAGKSFARGAAIATAATAAVGAGFLVLVRNALSAAEGIADMAARANTSTTALQELRFAVTQNGGSIRDADDALVRLNRRMSLFVSTGAGPGAQAFERLGINVQDASGNIRDSSDVFDEIVSKMSEMKDESELAALASSAFGEDAGPRLVPLIRQGTDGVRELREEAHKLGIVLEEDAIDKAAKASAQFRALGEAIQAQFTSALIQAAPLITDLAERLSQSLPTIIAWINALGQVVGLLDTPLEVQLSQNVNRIAEAQAAVAKIEGEGDARNPTKASRLQKAREELRQITLEQFAIQDQLEERAKRREANKPPPATVPNLPKVTGGGGGGASSASKALDADRRAADNAARSFAALTARLAGLRVERRQEIDLAGKSAAESVRITAAKEREARETEILEAAIRSSGIVTDAQIEQAFELSRELERLTIAKQDSADAEDARRAEMERTRKETDLMRRETETLSQAIFDAAFHSDGWKDALFRVGEAILQLESTQNFLAQSINALFGVAAEPASTSIGGGIFGALAGGIGDIFGSLFGGFFADGGSPPVGKFSVVGENGPELQYFGRSSTILSNEDSAALMGGRKVNAPFTTHIHGVNEQEIMSKLEIRLKRHRHEIFEDMAQLSNENPDYG